MTDDQQLADFVEWMTLQRDAERSLAERHGHSSTPMLRRAEFGLALVARVRAAEERAEREHAKWIEASNGCGEWGAQWAFADASLKRAQARIAQLEAELVAASTATSSGSDPKP